MTFHEFMFAAIAVFAIVLAYFANLGESVRAFVERRP